MGEVFTKWYADKNTRTALNGFSRQGSENKLIEYVFTNAFNLGRQAGYEAGLCNKASFDIDDDCSVDMELEDVSYNGGPLTFDASAELFDSEGFTTN